MSINIDLKLLRILSLIEGISYLTILFIGMPLKYGWGIKEINFILGMTHGILTIIFCAVLGLIYIKKILSIQWCLGVFIASLIPFGAFFAEKKLKEKTLP
tara:strand:- start:90 stop:389 length:300 start_codon:yes stop_codon:yes gene_type:complete